MSEVTKLYIPNHNLMKLDDEISALLHTSTAYMSLESIVGVLDAVSVVMHTTPLVLLGNALGKYNPSQHELDLAIALADILIPYLEDTSKISLIGALRVYAIDLWDSAD